MERVQRDHHVAARPELAHELDRRLVGLGAGVAEEHGPAQRARRQALGQRAVRLGVEEVGDVHQPPDLLLHRALTTAGWQWPRLLTAIPLRKSR